MNPVHVTQVAAVIAYEAARGRRPGTPELFVSCVVRELTPHASIGLTETAINPPGNSRPKYAEVIWAPVTEVSLGQGQGQNRRMADGLGGNFDSGIGNREGNSRLAHPGLFSLPSDDVVAGQRQAGIDCVRQGLLDLGLNDDIFEEFGVI